MTDSMALRVSIMLIPAALISMVSAATLVTAVQAAPSDFDHSKLARKARTHFIVPAYQRFATSLHRLEGALSKLCDQPSGAVLTAARSRYRDAVASWGRIEVIRFGPVTDKNRFERMFYWPDRKSIGRRQVQRNLRTKDQRALVPASLKTKSVAVQGLTALEFVLHGPGADNLSQAQPRVFRCLYTLAIVANLKAIATEIVDDWRTGGGFERIWSNPGPDNRAYLVARETTLELVKIIDHGLQNIRDRRIAPVLGYGANRKRKARPVLWRSRLSMVLIHANIKSIHDLFATGGLSEAYINSKPYNDERAADQMDDLARELAQIERLSRRLIAEKDLFDDARNLRRLVPIGYPLRTIRANAVGLLKAAAGLSIGFNASDGD